MKKTASDPIQLKLAVPDVDAGVVKTISLKGDTTVLQALFTIKGQFKTVGVNVPTTCNLYYPNNQQIMKEFSGGSSPPPSRPPSMMITAQTEDGYWLDTQRVLSSFGFANGVRKQIKVKNTK